LPVQRQAHRGEGAISVLALTFRFAIATVLAVAAFAKARSFDSFRSTVGALVSRRRGVTAVAAGVVATEGTLAALLASGWWASAGAAVTVALFLVFAALSLWAARRGLQVQCNCFGAGDRELGRDSLETSLRLAGATFAYWALLQRVEPSLTLGEVPLAVFLGIAAVLGARWALTAGQLTSIIHQRRLLDRELAESARSAAR
jgi:hypothetical protein